MRTYGGTQSATQPQMMRTAFFYSTPLRKASVNHLIRALSLSALFSQQRVNGPLHIQYPNLTMAHANTQIKLSSAEKEVRKAIQDIKDSDNAAYTEALRRAPELVASESRVDRFLRKERSNVSAAARLQALYWKERKVVFRDRAFLPLEDLSGRGALTEEDVVALSQGFVVRLPDDSAQRPCLLIDMSRSNEAVTSESKLRCFFYMLTVQIAQSPKAQTEGCTMIRLITTTNMDRDVFMRLSSMLQTSLPVKIRSTHICVQLPSDDRDQNMTDLMPTLVELTNSIKSTFNKIHTSHDRKKISEDLQVDGILLSALPDSLGGSWSYDTFKAWFSMQRMESKPDMAYSAAVPAAIYESDQKMSAVDESLLKASRVAQIQERKERKRQLDVIYARKRREREKNDTDSLQEQCYRLNQANMALKVQVERLQRLLDEAKRMAEVLEATNVLPKPSAHSTNSNYASEELLKQLLFAALAQQNPVNAVNANRFSLDSAPSVSPNVLLQFLSLSSGTTNTADNNLQVLMDALQQIAPILPQLQSSLQSQDVVAQVLPLVAAMLEKQNHPPAVTTNLVQLLTVMQRLQTVQVQFEQIQQSLQAQQQVKQSQAAQMDTTQLQEQLVRILRKGCGK